MIHSLGRRPEVLAELSKIMLATTFPGGATGVTNHIAPRQSHQRDPRTMLRGTDYDSLYSEGIPTGLLLRTNQQVPW